MERHKCKICPRTFINGKALGGHMKAHLAKLPLPPKPQQPPSDHTSSASASDHSSSDDEEEKSLIYGLRENPGKSSKLADPEFSTQVQDRESEAESNNFAPVQNRESQTESKSLTRRRRSKRYRIGHNLEPKRSRLSLSPQPEAEPASSVSDAFPEEDVARCLMMLSRDTRSNEVVAAEDQEEKEQEVEKSKIKSRKHKCHKCGKKFLSSRALGSHKSICLRDEASGGGGNDRIFECPFCFKVFGSGQALGGHKRSHLMASSSSSTANGGGGDSNGLKHNFIDLNFPAAPEDDDLSVVSDA